MEICVIGLGYIGLPTATLLAAAGNKVYGVDVNSDIIEGLQSGYTHVSEPGLAQMVKEVVQSGNLIPQCEVTTADVYIAAVPTPITPSKTADLSYVRSATASVVPYLQRGSTFIIESTIPLGCTEDVCIPILEESGLKAGTDFYVAHCPERVIPGKILNELVNNDRIVGGINETSALKAKQCYASFVKGSIFTTGLKEAELTKLAENSYRDVNIAFANELAGICERFGIDAWEVVRMANRHPRVNILKPGPGVGGHCIAVDPWFLVEACPDETHLIVSARKVNDARPKRIAAQVEAALAGCDEERPIVACLGLTYKANVDDMRESPSLKVVSELISNGFEVRVSDPYASEKSPYKCVSVEDAVNGADAVVLLVDHREYIGLNVNSMRDNMRGSVIIDTKGVWNVPDMQSIAKTDVRELANTLN